MATPDGIEPISNDELLYRRIPMAMGWYEPLVDRNPSPKAFRPRKHDTDGLSLSRAKYATLDAAAAGREGKQYYVAVLRVGDLRAAGIAVQPDPREGDPGHVILPALTYDRRRSDEALEMQVRLAEPLCLRVEGPFPR